MSSTLTALREALAHSPENVPLRVHLARTLLEAGRADEALVEARAAAAHDPGRMDAREVLGAAAGALGDDATLVDAWFPILTQLGADEVRVLALAAARTGRLEEARQAYAVLHAVDPGVHDLELDRAMRATPTAPPRPPTGPAAALPPARPVDTASEAPVRGTRPSINFADVGGLEALKERLRMDIVYPLQRPDLFKAYGKRMGGGVLLYGPPGCGKTHLARAAAGECGAKFFVVEIQAVLDMWLGESEKRLHNIFEAARASAPSIVFFDEIEAIGGARHQLKHGPGRRLVNQLLAELDGAGATNDGILVIGATNAPWDVDSALRRPGRFDRVVFVPPPDTTARESVLRLALRERPTETLDLASIAQRCLRFSGADLHHLVEVASERALGEALRTGNLRPITQSDLMASLDRVKPTTTEWIETARRYVSYANQAGVYDDVGAYLKGLEG
ncbi:MAG: AAA family ATPase [Myxococcales bacterium]|nr:AAA family ATPase [Myxococcales bacterium]